MRFIVVLGCCFIAASLGAPVTTEIPPFEGKSSEFRDSQNTTYDLDWLIDHLDKELEGQSDSVAVPIRLFADCMVPEHTELIKDTLDKIEEEYNATDPLEKRAKICRSNGTSIIQELWICANRAYTPEYPDFSDALSTVVYFPFHIMCHVEDPIALYKSHEAALKTLGEEYNTYGDRIVAAIKAGNLDKCFPSAVGIAYKKALANKGISDEFVLDSLQDIVNVAITFHTKTEFMPIRDCPKTLKEIFDEMQWDIHQIGYLHRDLKPANMCFGLSETSKHRVIILDFGLVRKYVNADGRVRPRRERAGFRGTLRYVSLRVHDRLEQGPADDLIALLYSLIELVHGELSWRKFNNPNYYYNDL